MILRNKDQERKTSAITLSDMEIFIFPELMYALVLANIMSPLIWEWLNDPWFEDLDKMNPYRRIVRLKQYIMDKYAFNLDLDTWGLTTQEKETARFKDFIDLDVLKKSNALFGYEGDKYYFDIDIRRHFGLDKYNESVIPYWKTETVEAMDAFKYMDNYRHGAGECVSLAALYAAALFIVAKISLSDIYLMATPLHSQNFVLVNDGVMTNNRRIVTKKMWVNGTALSAKARRALDHEKVTILAHESGYIHTLYAEATIDLKAYEKFIKKLTFFLHFDLSEELLVNFLRHERGLQKCFQLRMNCQGHDCYIGVEVAFAYEHSTPHLLSDNTRKKLLENIDHDELHCSPMINRIILNDLETFVKENKIDLNKNEDIEKLKDQFFKNSCLQDAIVIQSLKDFCIVKPKLPEIKLKQLTKEEPLSIHQGMTREEIIVQLDSVRGKNVTADLSFYAYRDLNKMEVGSFLEAAFERNPVCLKATSELHDEAIIEVVSSFPNESIYPGEARLSQPDEVWNYRRGDGVEKALLLAVIFKNRYQSREVIVEVKSSSAVFKFDSIDLEFDSTKNVHTQIFVSKL